MPISLLCKKNRRKLSQNDKIANSSVNDHFDII